MSRFGSAASVSRSPLCSPGAGTMLLPANDFGRSGTMIQTKHVYNPNRNTVYSRYTASDWEASNKANMKLSENEQNLAQKLRSDAWRAVKLTDQQIRNRQSSNTRKLSDRVNDISFWKEELMSAIRADDEEMENMKEYMRVVDRTLTDTKPPLTVAEECLIAREGRTGIDVVEDEVEKCLSKEINIIKKWQGKLQKILEKAAAQQKLTRSAQHNCDMDMRNKQHSQGLDDRMHQLHNGSAGLGLYPGIENVDNTITVPQTWVEFTQENLKRSHFERDASIRLRGEIDALLRACANDMQNIGNSANAAFAARIQAVQEAKAKLQAHLAKTMVEIRDMERTIAILRKAIYDKEAPMKLAQTRLEERTRRIHVENCNDPAMQGLQREVNEIREAVRVLKEKLREAENALCRLLQTRSKLEQDISTKERSLEIDSRACMGMRKAQNSGGPGLIIPMM